MSHREITATINIDASGKIFRIESSETLKDGDSFSGTVRVREQTCYGFRIPFDLEAAKRGEPLVTRDGRKARFVAHVPEAKKYRVVAHIEGNENVDVFCEDGAWIRGAFERPPFEKPSDLFMAQKPKRTVYVNLWRDGGDRHYDTREAAEEGARNFDGTILPHCIAVAAPVEVEA